MTEDRPPIRVQVLDRGWKAREWLPIVISLLAVAFTAWGLFRSPAPNERQVRPFLTFRLKGDHIVLRNAGLGPAQIISARVFIEGKWHQECCLIIKSRGWIGNLKKSLNTLKPQKIEKLKNDPNKDFYDAGGSFYFRFDNSYAADLLNVPIASGGEMVLFPANSLLNHLYFDLSKGKTVGRVSLVLVYVSVNREEYFACLNFDTGGLNFRCLRSPSYPDPAK